MKQFNSAWRLPDARITGQGRLNGGHITNTIALSIETKAASFPPRASARIGAR
jgi:hypothetical protein